jgi:hypothetical protein
MCIYIPLYYYITYTYLYRYLRPVVPKPGEPVRVAIDATLREAAKNQIWRKKEVRSKCCLYMYIYIWIHIHQHMNIYVDKHIYIYMYIYIYIYIYICIYIQALAAGKPTDRIFLEPSDVRLVVMYLRIYVCMHVWMYVWMSVYFYKHTCI